MYANALDCSAKNFSKRISLDLIRFTPGGISRAELARQMGLTRSALTTIIGDLVEGGLVREAEDGPASGGRRPVLLEINPQRGCVAGIDIGATHLSLLITDFAANVLGEEEVPMDILLGPQACLEQVDTHLLSLLNRLRLDLRSILAVGVGVPGPVVAQLGAVSVPPIMPGWDNFPIRSYLQSLWEQPVTLDNDADLGALGEWSHGAGRGERNLAYIKVGSGIGAGLLLNGNLYHGTSGSAGEIGHITIREDGPKCTCGSYGCLEAMAGGHAIAGRARAAVKSGRRTQLAAIAPLDKLSAREVAAAARLGDLVSQQIIAEAGAHLGIAIASLVNLFNPGLVVIGGGVAQIGDLLLEPIRKAVQERSLRSSAQAVRITAALLGRRSSSMGAAVQALNMALDTIVDHS
ncbi:MAG: ROK family transcriptional regulator [Chloroflexi bacterium]|nr:ROK family transcriptional regulator [Chloroflexota bacterium]